MGPSLPPSPSIHLRRAFTGEGHWAPVFPVKWSLSVVSDSLWPHGLQPARLLHPWDSPGKDTGVGCHFLLQGVFPTQGPHLGLLHCRQTLHHLCHQGIGKPTAPWYSQAASSTIQARPCLASEIKWDSAHSGWYGLRHSAPWVGPILLSSQPSLLKGNRIMCSHTHTHTHTHSPWNPSCPSSAPEIQACAGPWSSHIMQCLPSTDQEVTCGPGHELPAEEVASASSGERRKVNGHQIPRRRPHRWGAQNVTQGLSATSPQKKAKWGTQPGWGPLCSTRAPLGPRSPNKPKGPVLGAPGYSTFGKSPHEPLVGPVFSFTIQTQGRHPLSQ